MNIYRFYVYAYLRKDNTPYYIGKGHGQRAFDQKRKNIPKDHSRIKILHSNLLEEDTFKLEIAYIKLFGRKDLGTGILRNLTNGGEGAVNMSPYTKAKISKIAKERFSKPENNPMYGKTHSEKTKAKMSKLNKERFSKPENNPMYGKKRPDVSERNKKYPVCKGKRMWNNGEIQVFSINQPGKDYILGALKNSKKGKYLRTDIMKENNSKAQKKYYENNPKEKGKFKHTEESKDKMRKSRKANKSDVGFKWWNNGIITIRSKNKPGEEWINGRL